jgi:HAD superfamily hydrolase (TIGR01509 family)
MRFDAVLFDCDGVLVDSEPITNGVWRDMLSEQGWEMSLAECMRLFVGKSFKDEAALIAAKTGRPFSMDWLAAFWARRNTALEQHLQAIPHIHLAIERIHADFAGRIACASGADRFKVVLELRKVGLMPYFDGRIFSGEEMPRSKPFPDVYLAAAAALGADPRRCAVVEDTVTGIAAGIAAGCTVFGYCPASAGDSAALALRDAGASVVFNDMVDLPALLLAEFALAGLA